MKTSSKMSPFDFLNAINLTKENLIVDDETEKQYNAFMVNRGLSYFQDTALIANEMNLAPHLSSKPQFDFYIASLGGNAEWSLLVPKLSDREIEYCRNKGIYIDENVQQNESV